MYTMTAEYTPVQVDFYYDTFRSGKVDVPNELWCFDRTKPTWRYVFHEGIRGMITLEESRVYTYVQEVIARSLGPRLGVNITTTEIKLILLKKIKEEKHGALV